VLLLRCTAKLIAHSKELSVRIMKSIFSNIAVIHQRRRKGNVRFLRSWKKASDWKASLRKSVCEHAIMHNWLIRTNQFLFAMLNCATNRYAT